MKPQNMKPQDMKLQLRMQMIRQMETKSQTTLMQTMTGLLLTLRPPQDTRTQISCGTTAMMSRTISSHGRLRWTPPRCRHGQCKQQTF